MKCTTVLHACRHTSTPIKVGLRLRGRSTGEHIAGETDLSVRKNLPVLSVAMSVG